jgi:hypothetical protein
LGRGIVAEDEEGDAERKVRLQAVHRVGRALGQPVELVPQLQRRGQHPTIEIEKR